MEDDDFGLEGGDYHEGHGVRVGEGQVRMVTLDGVNQVGDVETPKEGRKTPTFR